MNLAPKRPARWGRRILLGSSLSAHPSAHAQVEAPTAPTDGSAERGASPPALLDANVSWARIDAEQSGRQAQLDRVDVRTPKIVTLSLLGPAAVLLLTAAVSAIVESSPVTPFDLLPHSGSRDEERRHMNPRNYWLAGAGGVLALGTIGTGIWWRLRSVERRRITERLGSASNGARLCGPAVAVQAGPESVGLVVRGRLRSAASQPARQQAG